MRPQTPRLKACFFVLVAVSLAGCGGETSKGQAIRVEGRLLEIGGPQPNGRPISGTIEFERRGHGSRTVNVGPTGRFAIDLAPATYSVSGSSSALHMNPGDCSGPRSLAVSGGSVTGVVVSCEVH